MGNFKKIIAVVGPTSSGKSDFAVNLANKILKKKKDLGIKGTEIISVDSRQIYKGFDISSGKITEIEKSGIKHHMLDIASPKRIYTANQFKKRAEKIIDRLHKENILPILCGGTNFWIDSILYDYSFPEVPPNKKLREKLEKKTTEELYKELGKKDKRRAFEIDKKNKRRLVRALEIIDSIKKVPALNKNRKYDYMILGIYPGKFTLDKRIKERLDKRIKIGMIEEIENIHKNGVSYKKLKNFGLEFKWTSRYLQNEIPFEVMKKGLSTAIIQFAKRQMTWLKKNQEILWTKKTQTNKDLCNKIFNFLE